MVTRSTVLTSFACVNLCYCTHMLLVLRNIFSLSHSRQKSTARFLSLCTRTTSFFILLSCSILNLSCIFLSLSDLFSLFDIPLYLSRSFLFLLCLLRRISSIVFGLESRRSFEGICSLCLADCTEISPRS